MTKKISLKRAAFLGALISPIILVVRLTVLDRWPREDAAFTIGYVVGSVGGGALLFVAIAAIINAFRR